jgi:hypothetical protein
MVNEKWFPSIDSPQVIGRFLYMERDNIPESVEADMEITREIIALEHKVAGSTDNGFTPMKSYNEMALRKRFPEAWKAFQGEEARVEGMPLKELSFLTEEQVIFLNLNGIHVVEQLAGLDDARCQGLGFGWRTNRNKAQSVLKEAIDKVIRQGMHERRAEPPEQTKPVAKKRYVRPKPKRKPQAKTSTPIVPAEQEEAA